LADDRHHRHYHPSDDGDADTNDEAWCTVDEACAVTGQVVFVGDDADASTP